MAATTTDRLVGVDLRCSRARCLFDWRVEGSADWSSITGAVGSGSGEVGVGMNADMDDFGGSSAGLGTSGQSQRLSAFGPLTAVGVGFGCWDAAGGAGGKVCELSDLRFAACHDLH